MKLISRRLLYNYITTTIQLYMALFCISLVLSINIDKIYYGSKEVRLHISMYQVGSYFSTLQLRSFHRPTILLRSSLRRTHLLRSSLRRTILLQRTLLLRSFHRRTILLRSSHYRRTILLQSSLRRTLQLRSSRRRTILHQSFHRRTFLLLPPRLVNPKYCGP